MSIVQRGSDFVLCVHSPKDKDENTLKSLIDTLGDNGFEIESRPGPDPEADALLFIKLDPKRVDELIEKDLVKNYEFGVTCKNDTKPERSRIIYSYLTHPKECGGVGIVPGKGKWSAIHSITPIAGYLSDKSLLNTAKKNLQSTELDTTHFRRVYGTEVALYFEFLKHYIYGLAVLSVFGIIAFFRSKNYSLTFSFINMLWGTVFMIYWKRRERYVVNFWGVQNSHNVDKNDAELTALNEKSVDKSTLKERRKRDSVKFAKQLAFIPVALVFVAILVTYQLSCFVLEIFLSEIYDGPGKSLLTLTPTVLISVFVPILTIVYNLVVDKFLDWENYDNDYEKNDSFVIKTFVLNFLTGYVPLLITSFVYLPFAHLIQPNLPHIQRILAENVNSNRYVYKYLIKVKSQQEFVMNQERLNSQYFYFIVTNQVIQFAMKYGLPLVMAPAIKFVTEKIKGDKPVVTKDSPEEKEWLETVRTTVQLPQHDVGNDFRGLALQYGYLMLFGPVWTLGPLVSLFFNVITFKLDELKLANGKYFRPPVPKRVDSIHPWDLALLLLTWIGSIISPIVTAFYRHGTKPPKPLGQFALDKASVNISSTLVLVAIFFLSEHLFFIIYVFGTKISNMLVSDKEVENDFVDQDIKLRRDFYHTELKSKHSPSAKEYYKEAEKAASSSYQKASKENSSLKNRAKIADTPEQKETRRELTNNMNEGDKIIETIGDNGKPTLAIIDNNKHFSPDSDDKPDTTSEKKDNEKASVAVPKSSSEHEKVAKASSEKEPESSSESSKQVKEGEAIDDEEEGGEDEDDSVASSSSKKVSKRKSLKKLLKRK
ncbi:putative increased sodium tolerance protein [Clavispora lusitaniae]|nr:Calcium-activated chloride channel family protein [Clavispora lusitaniae]OVF08807.1 hypothetical protein A9F13_07g02871 [Clavispora lusitaniae]QFZ27712.1 putative increased sodium tolerance protein [Clavispora lusitaniae]QFZ32981.1 putative increased sodium tolerance protein [Clavispora lusitaniae]QFZ38651.1 putative increased sodium tolerance protein [Clavispora lusitaniae]